MGHCKLTASCCIEASADTPCSYVAGGLALGFGVIAHAVERRFGPDSVFRKKVLVGKTIGGLAHYALMWLGTILITVGVGVSRTKGYMDTGAHAIIGWIILVWLWGQAIFGTVLAFGKLKFGTAHRVSGILLLALTIAIFGTIIQRNRPFKAYADLETFRDWSIAVVVVLSIAIVMSLAYFLPGKKRSFGASKADLAAGLM